MEETRWLNDEEQALWRQWLFVTAHLDAAMARQLLVDSNMSISDYIVLVHLTEAEGGSLRASELAEALNWERSRLSHHVGRMESRGLVERQSCASDKRGAHVVVTPLGRETIEHAAPGHVEQVRSRLFDPLTVEDLDDLRRILDKLADGLSDVR